MIKHADNDYTDVYPGGRLTNVTTEVLFPDGTSRVPHPPSKAWTSPAFPAHLYFTSSSDQSLPVKKTNDNGLAACAYVDFEKVVGLPTSDSPPYDAKHFVYFRVTNTSGEKYDVWKAYFNVYALYGNGSQVLGGLETSYYSGNTWFTFRVELTTYKYLNGSNVSVAHFLYISL